MLNGKSFKMRGFVKSLYSIILEKKVCNKNQNYFSLQILASDMVWNDQATRVYLRCLYN